MKKEIAEKVVAKLEAQDWVASANLWARIPGKERIYFELKSKEAIEELSGSLCSKRTFEKIESSWLDAERFSLRGGLENGAEARYGEISATAKAVLAIVAEAKAEVEAEAATSEAKATTKPEASLFTEEPEELASIAEENSEPAAEAEKAEQNPEAAEPTVDSVFGEEDWSLATEPAEELPTAPLSVEEEVEQAAWAALWEEPELNDFEWAEGYCEGKLLGYEEGTPLSEEQLAAAVGLRLLASLQAAASTEALSGPIAEAQEGLEPWEAPTLAFACTAALAGEQAVRSGEAKPAAEFFGRSAELLEEASLRGSFAWLEGFARELAFEAAVAAGEEKVYGEASELPSEAGYDTEREVLERVESTPGTWACLRNSHFELLEAEEE